jgi:hypothetical protein
MAMATLLDAGAASAGVVMNATRYIYPYLLAAWRIRGHLRNDRGDVWTRASNYHSRTPRFNARYRADLIRRAGRWATWLDTHFSTHDAVVDVTP